VSRKQNDRLSNPLRNTARKTVWLRASYQFHTFSYRDPRTAYSSPIGLPVVSPTTVLLGIVSVLFSHGMATDAQSFLGDLHKCSVKIDAPDGIVFFRAFHQIRRYETDKYDKTNPRMGFTNINQATKEYGIVGGQMIIYACVPDNHVDSVSFAMTNLPHLGTHDSMCCLIGKVEIKEPPEKLIYVPIDEFDINCTERCTAITLSRFKGAIQREKGYLHWHLAGGKDTEKVVYLIKGAFTGTGNGKIYTKNI
jgi:hypothetical protein